MSRIAKITQWIDDNENWFVGVVTLTALLYLWPNLIHEPLHWLTLEAFGGDAAITFDWTGWPAEPFTTHLFIPSVIAGLMYRIAPSLLSIAILLFLWRTKRKASLLTHIVLPLYLTFDLIINLIGYTAPGNDFHFFTVLNPLWLISSLLFVSFLGYKVIIAGVNDEVEEYQKKREEEVIECPA